MAITKFTTRTPVRGSPRLIISGTWDTTQAVTARWHKRSFITHNRTAATGAAVPAIPVERKNSMAKIRGNNDGPGGRNESYKIGSRPNVSRTQAVSEVNAGQHPGYHTVTVNRREYVRDNPDSSTKDNVNPDK
jgi:hypothetical protein